MHHRPTCAVRLFLALVLLAGPAFGQQESEEEDLLGIDEIVVTITKRSESLQDVSGTISAFNSELIRDTNIEKIADAVALIPNVQIKGGANQSISIRGISQSFVSQSPVARHVNGVFKWDNESYTGHFYDLDGIEVARGPSGTVYGRNATAGAVDIRWKKPHANWEVFGDVTLANTDRFQARGGVNIPLLGEGDERLMARLVFQREVHDGWVDNELTTRKDDPDRGDDFFIRGSLRSKLTEDIDLIVRGFRHKRKDGTVSSTPVLGQFAPGLLALPGLGAFTTDPYDGFSVFRQEVLAHPLLSVVTLLHQANNGFATPDLAAQDWLVNGFPGGGVFPAVPGFLRDFDVYNSALPVSAGDRQTRSSAHTLGDGQLTAQGIDGQLDWHIDNLGFLGDVDVVWIGGWERLDRTLITDLDGTELFVLDVLSDYKDELYTSDIRIQSAGDGPFEWTAGFFWFSRERNSLQDTIVSFVTPPSTSTVKESGFAPYLHLAYRPIDNLQIFGGVRWNRDRYFIDRSDPATSVQPLDLALKGVDKFREMTYEIGVEYNVTEDAMVYLKFAKGYKAGLLELDINAAVSTNNQQFTNAAQPEIVKAWEAGLRTSWLEGRLTANLTGFHYDYSNLQVTQITGAQALTLNAADATNWGVELELVFAPTPEWLIMLSAGHLDATFDEFCSDDPFQFFGTSEAGCPAPIASGSLNSGLGIDGKSNLEGKTLEDSPKWDITLVSRYEFDLGDWGTLTPVLEVQWTDDYFSRPYNLDIDRIDSRSKTDLRLIWESVEGRYRVELFVENLEDETVYGQRIISAEFAGGFPVQVGTFPPRIYGVRLGYHWGGK
jgi:iron complex outermembrane receptor protein